VCLADFEAARWESPCSLRALALPVGGVVCSVRNLPWTCRAVVFWLTA
jgi:hypothetical protein